MQRGAADKTRPPPLILSHRLSHNVTKPDFSIYKNGADTQISSLLLFNYSFLNYILFIVAVLLKLIAYLAHFGKHLCHKHRLNMIKLLV